MVSYSMLITLLATFSTAVLASPMTLETRGSSTNFASCWGNGSDGKINVPDNNVCTKAHTMDGYTTGTQKVPFGENYITMASSPTTGPWHCCYRCDQDPTCVGWQINDDCSCQTWKSTISCPPAAGTFSYSGPAVQNVSSIYHPKPGQCNA